MVGKAGYAWAMAKLRPADVLIRIATIGGRSAIDPERAAAEALELLSDLVAGDNAYFILSTHRGQPARRNADPVEGFRAVLHHRQRPLSREATTLIAEIMRTASYVDDPIVRANNAR